MSNIIPDRTFIGPENEQVTFGFRHRVDRIETNKAGRKQSEDPVLTHQERCMISFIGSTSVTEHEIDNRILAKYGHFYNMWKELGNDAQTGNPIREWKGCNEDMALKLEKEGILTVEMLSRLTDAQAQNVGPQVLSLRNDALKWVGERERVTHNHLAEMQKDNERMKQLIAEMAERMAAVESKAGRKAAT